MRWVARAIYLIAAVSYGIFAPISILVKFWPVDHLLSITAALACVFVAGYIWRENT